ncbi:hypothetical protein FSP39_012025 [Pinctada imbricata]|uniref:Uncharacterized protein n=1 Tax=Pinctada imbricata TaxID=66713 RepID=A0AA88Y927_PINIB|nr:hypothetical protein FSP39_012025 [Pinctada imbricata]
MLPVVRGCYPNPRDNTTVMAVDVITQKLREQSLEEANIQNKSQIKFIRPGEGLKLSKNAEATIAGTGKKVYTVQLKSNTGSEDCTDWRRKSEEYPTSDSMPQSHPHFRRFPSLRNKPCDNISMCNTDPPKKRHCRSLSVPVDGPAPTNWQPQQSHVWKPIAMATDADDSSSAFPPNFVNLANNSRTYNTQGAGFVCIGENTPETYVGGCRIPTDIFTPPESPVPRPSSASTCSGYRDSMFSPLSASWLEQASFHYNKHHAFENRSLSCEDQISCSSSSSSTASVPAFVSTHLSSPHRHRITRCRSQPSFIHDRKYGVKRRRDHDHRPSLNFHKMKETAYQRRPASHPMSTHRLAESRRSRFHDELEGVMSLMPIASSPLDNDIPIKLAMESRTSPISEMEPGRSDSTEFLDSETSEFIPQGPVKLIGEDPAISDTEDTEDLFPLQEDLDLEQIETN